jgi:predicted hydrolase (HD superfamily)
MSSLEKNISRAEAWELFTTYNKDPFHLQHGLTVEGVMRWYARDLGYGGEEEFWGNVGLLHDIDFELYPREHCVKAPDLLRAGGAGEALIHAVCSHGYGLTVDVKPEHPMEKVLYAADELTGLVWAAAIIRPSKSVQDMEVKSVKKKYKTPAFAAGCSREVIEKGAAMLGWELDTLIAKTILAMRSCEADIQAFMADYRAP